MLAAVVASGSLSGLRLFLRHLHVPGEAQQGEGADEPVARVDLPPAQAVAGRGRGGAMWVIPTPPGPADARNAAAPAVVRPPGTPAPPTRAKPGALSRPARRPPG